MNKDGDMSAKLLDLLERLGASQQEIDALRRRSAGQDEYVVVKALELEKQAHEMLQAAVDQLDSLTVDAWRADKSQDAATVSINNLGKLFNKDTNTDIITYGKAIIMAQRLMRKRFEKHRKITHRLLNHRGASKEEWDEKEELFTSSLVYIVLLKVRQDILANYEVDEHLRKGGK